MIYFTLLGSAEGGSDHDDADHSDAEGAGDGDAPAALNDSRSTITYELPVSRSSQGKTLFTPDTLPVRTRCVPVQTII